MDSNKLLKMLGLYVAEEFLDELETSAVVARMMAHRGEPTAVHGRVNRAEVKPATRRTESVEVGDDVDAMIRGRLAAVRDDVAHYFHVPLTNCESPQYLVYREGGYY